MRKISISRGAEWTPQPGCWIFAATAGGTSYWQALHAAQSNGAHGGLKPGPLIEELAPGSVIVLSGESTGSLRASQLDEIDVDYFSLDPDRLTGLLTLGEQETFRQLGRQDRVTVRCFPPTHPIAEQFRELNQKELVSKLSGRLQLLQLFVELFKPELESETANLPSELDGRDRLRRFLRQIAAGEFLQLSLSDLAPTVHCSPRHVSRLFRKEVGMSFRKKQTELRLSNACQLLATSNAKVAEVALTSGYESVSLFSLLFKRRYGVSPGKWRRRESKFQSPKLGRAR